MCSRCSLCLVSWPHLSQVPLSCLSLWSLFCTLSCPLLPALPPPSSLMAWSCWPCFMYYFISLLWTVDDSFQRVPPLWAQPGFWFNSPKVHLDQFLLDSATHHTWLHVPESVSSAPSSLHLLGFSTAVLGISWSLWLLELSMPSWELVFLHLFSPPLVGNCYHGVACFVSRLQEPTINIKATLECGWTPLTHKELPLFGNGCLSSVSPDISLWQVSSLAREWLGLKFLSPGHLPFSLSPFPLSSPRHRSCLHCLCHSSWLAGALSCRASACPPGLLGYWNSPSCWVLALWPFSSFSKPFSSDSEIFIKGLLSYCKLLASE